MRDWAIVILPSMEIPYPHLCSSFSCTLQRLLNWITGRRQVVGLCPGVLCMLWMVGLLAVSIYFIVIRWWKQICIFFGCPRIIEFRWNWCAFDNSKLILSPAKPIAQGGFVRQFNQLRSSTAHLITVTLANVCRKAVPLNPTLRGKSYGQEVE